MTETWVHTGKGRLFAKSWGDRGNRRPPVILFHDSLGCVALWRSFPERLSQASGRSVIAYDRLGFGQSDPHAGWIGFDFIEREAQEAFPALRAHFGFERFAVLGHSVGGEMAVSTAAAYGAECEALVTVSAQAFVEERTLAGIREAERAFAKPGEMDRLKKYHGEKAQWVLNAWTKTWLAPEFADWNLDVDLARVKCPVLAVHGEDDEYGSPRHPARIASVVAGPSRAEIIAGCGHVPHREREELLVDLVCRFLNGQAAVDSVDSLENRKIAS